MAKYQKQFLAIIVFIIGVTFFFTGVIPTLAQETAFRIGGTVPITGRLAHFGAWISRGAEMALDELGQKGWIGGKKIEIIWEDNEYEPRRAISAFNKLVFMDKVNIFLSGGSPIVRALAPLAEKNKVVQLYCSSSNVEIKKSGNYTFKIMGGHVTECLALAKFARDVMKAKTAATIGSDTEYGQGGMKLFKEYFESMGGKVVAVESVRPGERDFGSVLTRINIKKPDLILIILTSVEGGYVAKYAKRLGIKAHLLGGMNLYSSETLKTAGKACEGLFAVGYQFDPVHGTPNMKAFAKKFKERYGGFPSIVSAVGYDAVMLYAEAVKHGAKSSDEVKNFLRNDLKDFKGVTGDIVFDSYSENMPTHRILQAKGGKFVEVKCFEKFTEKELK